MPGPALRVRSILYLMTRRGSGKKRKKRQKSRVKRGLPSRFGYDFARRTALLLGAPDFPRLLFAADVRAVVYGFDADPALPIGLPSVWLLGAHQQPLVEAFEQFAAWTAATDDDAVDLSWVFLNSGGYLLTLAPEQTRLQQRLLSHHRDSTVAISMAPIWIKQLDK